MRILFDHEKYRIIVCDRCIHFCFSSVLSVSSVVKSAGFRFSWGIASLAAFMNSK
jgi:hypothetical protein